MSRKQILVFTDVDKSFGTARVLNGLSFDVLQGEILVLLGPNGAGKSTTMSLATGLLAPTKGKIEILGSVPTSLSARRNFAYVPQDSYLPTHASGFQFLEFLRAHRPNSAGSIEMAQAFRIDPQLHQPLGNLSGGQRRLFALAGAFLGRMPLMIFDEPTVGLDIHARHRFYAQLRQFAALGGTVLMTTHYLAEAEDLATRILVLHQGQTVFSGSPLEIKSKFGFKRISFRAKTPPPPPLAEYLSRRDGEWWVDSSRSDEVLKEIMGWGEASDVEVVPVPLEEIFLSESGQERPWL